MTYAQELGKFAEDLAAEYLVSLGWKVLERNVRVDHGEIDIVALDVSEKPEELVFAEVRCRFLGEVQSPLDSIGSRKLRTLLRASQELADKIDWQGFWRIDVIAVTIHDKHNRESWELEHVKDITS
ncbi:MAG: YraN family protein [Synergistaceae bacterium]|nr:YraN family protein [Synergistaceae bacterium]